MGAGRKTQTIDVDTGLGGAGRSRVEQGRGRGDSKPPPPPPRLLASRDLGGVIFGCTKDTIQECFSGQLFGLPRPHMIYVQHIQEGLPLFLFNYTAKVLHGVFEAAGDGEENINPYAWSASGGGKLFPAQVPVRIRQYYSPLPESVFRKVIAKNYYSKWHFQFELDHIQTRELCALFIAGKKAFLPYTFGRFSEREFDSPAFNMRSGKAALIKKNFGSSEDNRWTNPHISSQDGGWINYGESSQGSGWTVPGRSSQDGGWKNSKKSIQDGGWTNPSTSSQDGGWTDPKSSFQYGGWTNPGTTSQTSQDGGRTNPKTSFQDGGWTNPGTSSQDGGWTNPSTSFQDGGWPNRDTSQDGGWRNPKSSFQDGGWTNPDTLSQNDGWANPSTSFQDGGWTNPDTSSQNGGWTDARRSYHDEWTASHEPSFKVANDQGDSAWQKNDEWFWEPEVSAQKSEMVSGACDRGEENIEDPKVENSLQILLDPPSTSGNVQEDQGEWLWEHEILAEKSEMESGVSDKGEESMPVSIVEEGWRQPSSDSRHIQEEVLKKNSLLYENACSTGADSHESSKKPEILEISHNVDLLSISEDGGKEAVQARGIAEVCKGTESASDGSAIQSYTLLEVEKVRADNAEEGSMASDDEEGGTMATGKKESQLEWDSSVLFQYDMEGKQLDAEQLALKEGRDNLLLALQPVDSIAASGLYKNMELCAKVLAEMRHQEVYMRNFIEEAKSLVQEVCELKYVQREKVALQKAQQKAHLSIVEDVHSLKEDIKDMRSQVNRAFDFQ